MSGSAATLPPLSIPKSNSNVRRHRRKSSSLSLGSSCCSGCSVSHSRFDNNGSPVLFNTGNYTDSGRRRSRIQDPEKSPRHDCSWGVFTNLLSIAATPARKSETWRLNRHKDLRLLMPGLLKKIGQIALPHSCMGVRAVAVGEIRNCYQNKSGVRHSGDEFLRNT
jgi:hypothetical protein